MRVVVHYGPGGQFRDEYEATLESYLASIDWARTRRRYLMSGRRRTCYACGNAEIQLHHTTYVRAGHEHLDDLVPLCEWHHYEVEKVIKMGWDRSDAHVLRFGSVHADARRGLPLPERQPEFEGWEVVA
jgi:hypothetical protein